MLTAKEVRQVAEKAKMEKDLKRIEKRILEAAERGYTKVKIKGKKSKQFWCHMESLGFHVYHEKPRPTEMETYVAWSFYSDEQRFLEDLEKNF